MPKVSATSPTSHCRIRRPVHRSSEAPRWLTVVRRVLAVIILAIIAVAAFSYAHRTTSDFVQLTLKQGPAPAMLGAASTGLKSGE